MQQLPKVRPPADDAFGGKDFLPAPDIEQVAEMLRERHNLPVGITFSYLWKRRAGKKGGVMTRGWCQKLSGPTKYFADTDFLLWLGADSCRGAKYTQEQYVALVFHELNFAGVSVNEETFEETPILKRVDFEGFLEEIKAYGLWERSLEEFAAAAEQAPLWPAAEPVAAD